MSRWCGRVEKGGSTCGEDVAAVCVDAFRGERPDVALEELTSEVVGAGLDFATVATTIVAPSTVTRERIESGGVVEFALGIVDTFVPSTVTIAGLLEARLLLVQGAKISSVTLRVPVSSGLPVSLGGSTVTIGSSLWPSRGACAAVSFV